MCAQLGPGPRMLSSGRVCFPRRNVWGAEALRSASDWPRRPNQSCTESGGMGARSAISKFGSCSTALKRYWGGTGGSFEDRAIGIREELAFVFFPRCLLSSSAREDMGQLCSSSLLKERLALVLCFHKKPAALQEACALCGRDGRVERKGCLPLSFTSKGIRIVPGPLN